MCWSAQALTDRLRPNLIRAKQQEEDISLITLPHMLREDLDAVSAYFMSTSLNLQDLFKDALHTFI